MLIWIVGVSIVVGVVFAQITDRGSKAAAFVSGFTVAFVGMLGYYAMLTML